MFVSRSPPLLLWSRICKFDMRSIFGIHCTVFLKADVEMDPCQGYHIAFNHPRVISLFLYHLFLPVHSIFVQNAFVKMMQSYEGQDGLNFTQDEIFGIFDLPGNLSLDSREGRLVSRDVKSVLICFDALEHVAFEAAIKEISVTRAVVLFSKDVIHALGLKKEMLLRAKIQWQLSRQDFLRQHQSVDNVKDHLKILFHSGNQKEVNFVIFCEEQITPKTF